MISGIVLRRLRFDHESTGSAACGNVGLMGTRSYRKVPAARIAMGMTVSLFAALVGSAGCQSDLETGYKPRKVGVSSAERRGFYASPFTPEAKAAGLEREQELEARRPTPGY